jgi:hypothetical protein
MEILLVKDNWDDAPGVRISREGIQHRLTWLWDGEEASSFAPPRKMAASRIPTSSCRPGFALSVARSACRVNSISSCEIPVVVMTASKDHEDVLRSERLQVDGLSPSRSISTSSWAWSRSCGLWHADLILPGV